MRKIFQHLPLHLFLLALLLSVGFAQETRRPGNKRQRTVNDYTVRTLAEIFSLKPDHEDLRDKQDRLVVTREIIPSRVRVTSTGATRVIPPEKKESIRQWARLYAGSMEHYTEPYQSEMEFVENGVRYWLAVGKNSNLFKQGIAEGVELDLFLIRLGAVISGDKYDWTLLVEDFRPASDPAVEIQFGEMRLGRPPLVNLTVELVLRNTGAEPRWFLIPSNLGKGHPAIGEKGGIDALEVFAPEGQGRVVIGRFLGTAGFHALLLPAHAEIRLQRFPISYWGELPKTVNVEVVIAKKLSIGNESGESWLGDSALSDVRADIVQEAEDPKLVKKSRHTADNKEVAPVIDAERRVVVTVMLTSSVMR